MKKSEQQSSVSHADSDLSIQIYDLLPAVYHIRDAEQGYPLKALLKLINAQADIVKRDIDGLYDDMFIETCQEWLIPYIGDLVGNTPLEVPDLGERVEEEELLALAKRAAITRADVGRTIKNRRSKGTLPMLEQLARDVTRWSAKVVPFYEQLAWTQNLNHTRIFGLDSQSEKKPEYHLEPFAINRVATAHVRDVQTMGRVGDAFNIAAHTVDVRQLSERQGWFGIQKIGIFLWRLQALPLNKIQLNRVVEECDSRGSLAGCYYINPLGVDTSLFNKPATPAEGELTEEQHVADFILRTARPAVYTHSIQVFKNKDETEPISADKIEFCDLKNSNTSSTNQVSGQFAQENNEENGQPLVFIDVERGRIKFAETANAENLDPSNVRVSYHYGFSAAIGGGGYPREVPHTPQGEIFIGRDGTPDGQKGIYKTLRQAINVWDETPEKVIVFKDSDTYEETKPLEINLAGRSLTIRSESQQRPHLKLHSLVLISEKCQCHKEPAPWKFALEGILIEAIKVIEMNKDVNQPQITKQSGGDSQKRGGTIQINLSNGSINLSHTTIVPGGSLGDPLKPELPSIKAGSDISSVHTTIDASIVGLISLPSEGNSLKIRDSIVQGIDPAPDGEKEGSQHAISGSDQTSIGPETQIVRSTIFGKVDVVRLKATDTIFDKKVDVADRVTGCMRYCFIPEGSQTGERFRCQPDLAKASGQTLSSVEPVFTSKKYGNPGYAQLRTHYPEGILRGGSTQSEMGVFNHLLQPQRIANLETRFQEYLPFGMEHTLIYQS